MLWDDPDTTEDRLFRTVTFVFLKLIVTSLGPLCTTLAILLVAPL